MIRHLKRLSHVAALTVILAAAGASPALAGGIDGALKYVPMDFTTVVAVNIDSMRSSAIFGALQGEVIGAMGGERDIRQLKAETGFDVMSDVKSVVYAGPDKLFRDEDQFIIVMEAKYDGAKLMAYIKKAGAKLEAKGSGATAHYVIDGGEGGIAFHKGYIVAGPMPLFAQAMSAVGGKNVTGGPLGKSIAKFKSSKSGFAVMGQSDNVRKMLGGDDPEFKDLMAAGMGLDFSSGVKLSVLGSFAKAGSAKGIAGKINGALKEMTSDAEIKELGIDKLASKIKVGASGKDLSVSIKLSNAEVQTLLELVMALDGDDDDGDWE